AGVVPVVNDQVEKEGVNVGYKPFLYRIGGSAAAAVLGFMMVKMLPQDDKSKPLSKNYSDLNMVGGRNSGDQEDRNIQGKPTM
ncbi:hypothetical protein SB659_20135, partial [Arthrobacter sp. SIMBA_036]|uniref:hypothetical protein n=1 Tax=Arthrobacter sp. SIMBA_036 TaxID=3085778 RepID=UPI00397DEA13